MRISIADAKRLGIETPAKKKTRRKAATPGDPATPVKAGNGRLPVADYGRQSIRIELDLPDDPQVKERARTVPNIEGIVRAFIEARGSVARFRELLKGNMSHTFTPKNTAAYEALVRAAAMSVMATARLRPFSCPVKTHLHFVFAGDPMTWPTARGDGDADNLEKAVMDALNGVVFADDCLIVRTYRTKSCGEKARLVIKVSPASSGFSRP